MPNAIDAAIAPIVRDKIPAGYEPRVHDVPMTSREAISWAKDWVRRGYEPILIKTVVDGENRYSIYGKPPRY